MRLDLFHKQISLTLVISDRNEGDCREKNMFHWKVITHPHGYQILVLFIVFEFLLSTYTLD